MLLVNEDEDEIMLPDTTDTYRGCESGGSQGALGVGCPRSSRYGRSRRCTHQPEGSLSGASGCGERHAATGTSSDKPKYAVRAWRVYGLYKRWCDVACNCVQYNTCAVSSICNGRFFVFSV